ncbi:MAG: GNAT family N-acetyltransferase [Candidatus Heimdallarchaeota archaeon]|nr:GNAT family N-acetyltransferase [Candidatus Heimdallarchaeota archaeon]
MEPILLDIPNQFESERLILRSYKRGDGEAYYNLAKENYDHLKNEAGEVKELNTVEKAEKFIRERWTEWETRQRLVVCVEEKLSGKMIGQMWLEPNWKKKIMELGYFIIKEKEGLGLVTEASIACVKFIFETLDIDRIEIQAKYTNTRSWKVAERLGFTKEGQFREQAITDDGTRVDQVFYGLLKREYQTLEPYR